MLREILVQSIVLLENLLSWLLILYVLLSFFVPPWNPWRQGLARIMEPLLAPIRRVVPPLGPLDLSPLVLLLLIQVIAQLLISVIVQL